MFNRNICVDHGVNIKEAMEILDSTARKIVLITNGEKVIATLSDGDIRRALINGISINEQVIDIANKKFNYITEDNIELAKRIMKEKFISCVPVVDSEMRLINVYFTIDKKEQVAHLNIPVVIQAGGFGTRLYPYTKILPKPLIPIGDLPVVEHIINKLFNNGCNEFYLIVNHKKNMIKSYFNDINHPYTLHFIDEDKPLGTGGGLSLLKGRFKGDFIFTNCDILIDCDYSNLLDEHRGKGNAITMVCANKKVKIPYGVIELDENGKVVSIAEKPEFIYKTNTGLYVANSNVIDDMQDNVAIGFPSVFEKYCKKDNNVGVFLIEDDQWMDMGELEELEKMRQKIEQMED